MSEGLERIDAATLIERIASKSKRSEEDVRSALARNGVAFKPSLAVPKRLCMRSLSFTGEKQGEKVSGNIDFAWDDLGPGLWAITSGRNFRGKSTLLAIFRWCLTGRRGEVPGEMKAWFRTVRLVFALDGLDYEVELTDAVTGSGALSRLDGLSKRRLASFVSETEFESVMSDFFMGQLGLQRIVSFAVKGERGMDQAHDWGWLSGALVIETSPSVLFGSVSVGGLATRMMQMYLGIPWTDATNDIMAAKARIQNEVRQNSAAVDRTRERRDARIKELDAEIGKLTAELAALPTDDADRAALLAETTRFSGAEKRGRSGTLLLAAAEADLEAARESHARARRELQDFKDGRAASYVFRSLDPVCCPRCDEVFGADRRSETREDHLCLVCGTPEEPEGNPATLEASLKEAVAEADAETKRQRRRHETIVDAIKSARDEMRDAEAACAAIESRLAGLSNRRDVELDLARREARREELTREAASMPAASDDAGLLDIAEDVAKGAFAPLQKDLLADASALILDYAVRFGFENLEKAELRGNTTLRLHKGGPPVWFGGQTAGERVRLKVAATLAILKVAEERGLGRHPGVLLVDTPGGSEMVNQDYDHLIAGLAQLTAEMPHVQVFVAAVNSPTIRTHVPETRILGAEGDAYLW